VSRARADEQSVATENGRPISQPPRAGPFAPLTTAQTLLTISGEAKDSRTKFETIHHRNCSNEYPPPSTSQETQVMSAILESAGCVERESLPGLWFNDGVYYAEIRHPASESPIRVALHGISTPQAACEALSLLAQHQVGGVPLGLP
jgi:hypothetical protein